MDRLIYRKKGGGSRVKKRSSNSLFNNRMSRMALLIVSVFLLYNVGHSISITVQKLDILQKARVEVDNLRLKNLELALLIENIQGVEYLEIQARDRLKFAGEGEYVFVIPEDVLEDAHGDLERLLMEDKKIEERKVYEVWGDFLIKGV
jgi:cell division protein FtsB